MLEKNSETEVHVEKIEQRPMASIAFGLERIGLIAVQAPILSCIVLVALIVGAIFGIERIKIELNQGLSVEGVVITMFDDRTNLAQSVAADLRGFFGDLMCETTIPRNIRLAEAPSHGKPALLYDPGCRGAEAYLQLAGEIRERDQRSLPQPQALQPGTAG